jgi:cellobiose-specific phosphotransferase system component IIB
MVIGGGATTSMVTPSMVTKATSKTKKTNTINLI